MRTNTVITNWKKGTTEFECINPNGVSTILGSTSEGEEKIASPKAIMLGSLAVCSGLDIVAILKKMRVEVEDFRVEVHGELTEEIPKMYHTVKVDYYFGGEEVADNKDKIEKAVNLSIDKYCGVYQMFKQFADVSFEIHYL